MSDSNEIPLINGRKLFVRGKRKYKFGNRRRVAVKVHDLKFGEFSYNTDTVVIRGVDLRVQGDKIDFADGAISLRPLSSPPSKEETYLLMVKGSEIRIDGIRTGNVEWVRISNAYEIEAEVEGNTNKAFAFLINWWGAVNLRAGFKSIFYSLNLFVLLVALVAMTWLPFGQVNYALDKYNEVRWSAANTSVECVRSPVEVSNKLSLQMVGCGGETNSVATTSTSTSAAVESGKANANRKSHGDGGGVVVFYFVLACLLYLALYVVGIFLAVATFNAMRRHNKMTRNMSSAIEALRNERDKDKRKAMQKKILDDMIDTYLDKPSSED